MKCDEVRLWHEIVLQEIGVREKIENQKVEDVIIEKAILKLGEFGQDQKNQFLINLNKVVFGVNTDYGLSYNQYLHGKLATNFSLNSLVVYKNFYLHLYKFITSPLFAFDREKATYITTLSFTVLKIVGQYKNYNSLYKWLQVPGVECLKNANIFEQIEKNDDLRPLQRIFKGIRNASSYLVSFNQIANFINQNEKKMYVVRKKADESHNNKLFILKRFSSQYPSLSTDHNILGGGFYVRWKNKGIVVDPGYNFLQQFVAKGLAIVDIDCIFVTHAHDDHTADLEKIYSYLNKFNKINNQNKEIIIFGSKGVAKKYNYLRSKIKVLNKADNNCEEANSILTDLGIDIKIATYDAFHNERPIYKNNGTCIGIGLKCRRNVESYVNIIFSGDTRFNSILAEQYLLSNPHYIVLNIGNMETEGMNYDKNHLGLLGATQIINKLTRSDQIPQLYI